MATIEAQIRIRRDTAANFTSANPTLALGEIAYETDTRNIKVGDGATAWTALGYINSFRGGTAAAPTSNTVLGSGAGAGLTGVSSSNTVLGSGAGAVLTGDNNTFVGHSAGGAVASGTRNVAVGRLALQNGTGTWNTVVGELAAAASGGWNSVTAIGNAAARFNTASSITAVGANALDANTTGTQNTAVGTGALGANTTGPNNVAVGFNAMSACDTGDSNTAVGTNALGSLIGAVSNVAVGRETLIFTTSGNQNVAVGQAGLGGNTTGSNNISIGHRAARFQADGTTSLTDPEGCVYIGVECRGNDNNDSNAVVIAGRTATARGVGDGANTTVIGNAETTSTRIPAGNLTLTNGNFIVGHAGKGIDFSATGNGLVTSAFAARGWVQRTATNVANNDTVTIGTTVYTFKTALTPANWEVLIGADSTASLTNLRHAILGTGGTPGTDYQVPNAHPTVTAEAINGLRLPLRALTAGSAGNSIALAETSAQLTVSAATLTGGVDASGVSAELLDDYEEGTWSPDFQFSAGQGDALFTYSTRVGRYVKVGRVVHIWGELVGTVTHSTAVGQPRINNVPFTAVSGTSPPISITNVNGFTLSAGYTWMAGIVIAGSNQLRLDQLGSGVAAVFLTPAAVTSNGNISISVFASYYTTS